MIKNVKISVCIPTYEMYGKGVEFLDFNIKKIKEQEFKDFEVIISDHSKDNLIEKYVFEESKNLNIKYFSLKENFGNSSANINNAIKQASGEYIKIIFQDDFLFHKNSLNDIEKLFFENPSKKWLVSASEHSRDGFNFEREFQPTYNDEIYLGYNTISSPSVLCFKNEDIIFFDENLVWLMDVDYYKRLFIKNGDPIFLRKVNVVNRIWDKQNNNVISQSIKDREMSYIKEKFNNY